MTTKPRKKKITTKAKIDEAVKAYKKIFAKEYKQFRKEQKLRRSNLRDPEYASVEATEMLKSQILEYPEILFYMLRDLLDDKEWNWFTSIEGAHWFAEKYRAFKIPKKLKK